MPNGGLLTGRVAIIAGGGGEIGGAIARRYAREGAASPYATYRLKRPKPLRAISSLRVEKALDSRSMFRKRTIAGAARATVDAFGKITDLVNASATLSPDGNVENLSTDAWRNALDVNFTGVFLMCKHVMGHIRAAGGGAVVNIASSHGHFGLPVARPIARRKPRSCISRASWQSITARTISAPTPSLPDPSTRRARFAGSARARTRTRCADAGRFLAAQARSKNRCSGGLSRVG